MWMAGAMMWLGVSPASCTMYSPRSVSTASMPASSSQSLRPISSLTSGLSLGDGRCAGIPADLQHDAARLGVVTRPVDGPSRCLDGFLEGDEIGVEMIQDMILDADRLVDEIIELRQRLPGTGPSRQEIAPEPGEVGLQLGVSEGLVGAVAKPFGS